MKALHLYKTEPSDDIVWPEHEQEITLSSPARTVFTDFALVPPLTITATRPALEAEQAMRQAHVEMKVVVDAQEHLTGVISLEHLHEQEIMKRLFEGKNRNDLLVRDFMVPKERLKAFSYHELERSTIADVLETLKSEGQELCLVVERNSHQVRGVISAGDIARKLGKQLRIERKVTFAHLFQEIKPAAG